VHKKQILSTGLSIFILIFSLVLARWLEVNGLMEHISPTVINYVFAFALSGIIWCLLQMFWVRDNSASKDNSKDIKATENGDTDTIVKALSAMAILALIAYVFTRRKSKHE
jgi:hypothetical protein